jgi:hypothetical protein
MGTEILISILGHLSFGLSAVSFAMRSLLWLRIIAMFSLIVGIGYNLAVPQVYWLVVGWLCVFLLINLFQTITLTYENNEVSLDYKLGLIRAQSFPGMPSRAFVELYKHAQIQSFDTETVVVEQGGTTSGLSLITHGQVVETLSNKDSKIIVTGQFFGDLTLVQPSVLTESPTLCTATAGTTIAYWPYEQLTDLFNKNERIKSGVYQAVSYALATKHTIRLK